MAHDLLNYPIVALYLSNRTELEIALSRSANALLRHRPKLSEVRANEIAAIYMLQAYNVELAAIRASGDDELYFDLLDKQEQDRGIYDLLVDITGSRSLWIEDLENGSIATELASLLELPVDQR